MSRFRKGKMYPDFSIGLAESFCRDPDGAKGAPWCYTLDPHKKWEFCDVLECSKVPVGSGFCDMRKYVKHMHTSVLFFYKRNLSEKGVIIEHVFNYLC